jgi:hypothetical protein
MPEAFQCLDCGLAFEVGWFHYHELFRGHFGASTYLVCSACGTWHNKVHHRDREQPDLLMCIDPAPHFRPVDWAEVKKMQESRAAVQRGKLDSGFRLRMRKAQDARRLRINLLPGARLRRERQAAFLNALELAPALLLMLTIYPVMWLVAAVGTWWHDRGQATQSQSPGIKQPCWRELGHTPSQAQVDEDAGLLATLACGHCGRSGTLSDGRTGFLAFEGASCPSCRKPGLFPLKSYIT